MIPLGRLIKVDKLADTLSQLNPKLPHTPTLMLSLSKQPHHDRLAVVGWNHAHAKIQAPCPPL